MKTVLVFAGTTEGRELLEIFDRSNISVHACVATEYGSQVLKPLPNITVHTGRLDENGMRQLMQEIGCDIVVDATHPYAVVVSSVIRKSLEGTNISYIRLLRDSDADVENDGVFYYDDAELCAEKLAGLEGNILLTTGSKELSKFTSVDKIKDRLIARVIPGMESLKLCYDAGLEGSRIIAMQGPFSQEMNEAIIKEYGIAHLVTKESGVTGGFNEKIAAAGNMGIAIHIIKRPVEGSSEPGSSTEERPINAVEAGLTMSGTLDALEKKMKVRFDRGRMLVTLAGMGPGSAGMRTREVEAAIKESAAVFGAERMLDQTECRAAKYPFYLSKDIVPILEKMASERYKDTRAVILFSGDSGFYSGSKKMYETLVQNKNFEVEVLPGISSVSMLSARLGTDRNDCGIVSLHGIEEAQWIPRILDSVKHNGKTFFITSGVKDVRNLGELLEKDGGEYRISLGYRLSYPDEKILKVSPEECRELETEGLYCGLIESGDVSGRTLVPNLNDDFFIRDKVPMTKEEVRKLSICRLNIKEGDVVYDIGSGSGSVSVQIGALSPTVRVYALECNPEAVALTESNVAKAKLMNVQVISAMAPEGLEELPVADAAFIGGSKGNLQEILSKLKAINPTMRVVMNAVSMETICEMNRILENLEVRNLSVTQVSVSNAKKLGDYHMLSANNPVFVYSFDL